MQKRLTRLTVEVKDKLKIELESDPRQRLYLASILMLVTVDNEIKNIVNKNLHLIQAESDDAAYEKSVKLGRDSETDYLNSKDQLVKISFIGLAELELAIEDDIYDGMELAFEQFEDLTSQEIDNLVSLKKDLDAFSLNTLTSEKGELDYGSKEVRKMAKKMLKNKINRTYMA